MKKTLFIFSVLVIASVVLSACGPTTAAVLAAPAAIVGAPQGAADVYQDCECDAVVTFHQLPEGQVEIQFAAESGATISFSAFGQEIEMTVGTDGYATTTVAGALGVGPMTPKSMGIRLNNNLVVEGVDYRDFIYRLP